MAESRQPAPEPLLLVQELVNTCDVESGTDELATPSGTAAWLRAHDLLAATTPVRDRDRRVLVELREALRTLLLANNGEPVDPDAVATLNRASRQAPLAVEFDRDGGAALVPARAGVAGALGRIAAIVLASMADGTWARLKACPEHRCHWAFYDRSKNRSGTWCVMSVCGNRAKARTYRERASGLR